MVDNLASTYDVVLLDLPPIGEVSDALVASRCTDGLIVIVRNDYTNASDLEYALRQCEMVGAKVIGFVFNCSEFKSKKYKYGYGKKYGYGYGYAAASKKRKPQS